MPLSEEYLKSVSESQLKDRAYMPYELEKYERDSLEEIKKTVKNEGYTKKEDIQDSLDFLEKLANKINMAVTNEKKDVLVDFYVEWKIENLELFYTRTEGNKSKAEILLSQKSIDGLRAEFGKNSIKDVVSGTRLELMEKLRKITDESAATLGISVIDVRIKRIDLPEEVSGAVYDRMRSERIRVASELKAKGEAEAIVIRAMADQKKRILLAEAEQKAKNTRGNGDAEASKIYAKAYEQAPQFFEFYRSLGAYKKVFSNKNDILVLKPDGDFFKYFNSINNKQ